MSNGNVESVGGGKMAVIAKKINYAIESSKKNLNLSSEIRAKLLSTDPKVADAAEKTPRASGQLNGLIDNLQDILDTINSSNAHLVAVNKEI